MTRTRNTATPFAVQSRAQDECAGWFQRRLAWQRVIELTPQTQATLARHGWGLGVVLRALAHLHGAGLVDVNGRDHLLVEGRYMPRGVRQ